MFISLFLKPSCIYAASDNSPERSSIEAAISISLEKNIYLTLGLEAFWMLGVGSNALIGNAAYILCSKNARMFVQFECKDP
jgi:hypothetical protein